MAQAVSVGVSREACRPIRFLAKKETEVVGAAGLARSSKLRDVMVIAEKEGLLGGERTRVVRGRSRKPSWPGQKNALESIPTRT